MDIIKKIWPESFKVQKGNVASLIWRIVISVVIVAVFNILCSLLGGIPVLGTILSILSYFTDLYLTAGIVFCFLVFFQVGPFKS